MKIARGAALAALALQLAACAHLAQPESAQVEDADSDPAALAPVPAPPTAAEQALTTEQRSRLYYHILLAEIADGRGQYDIAYTNYLHAAKASERPELARSAAIAAERGEDPEGSYQAASLWTRLEPEATDAHELLAIGYIRKGQAGAAEAELRTVVTQVKARNGDVLRELLRVIETEPKPVTQTALAPLADSLNDDDVDLAAAHLALRLRDWPTVERRADAALQHKPGRIDAVKMKVLALQAQNRTADALAALDAERRRNPDSRDLILTQGQLLQHMGQPGEARKVFEDYLAHHDDMDVRFALAGLAYDERDYATARREFEAVAAAGQHTEIALYYLGDIAARDKDMVRALAYFRQVNGGRFQFDAQINIAHLLADAGQLDAARSQLHQAAIQMPGRRLDFIITELDVLRDAGELATAKTLLADSMKLYPDDVQLLLAQAQLASLENDYALTRSALEKALAQVDNPDIRKQLILAGSEVLRGANQGQAAMGLINRGLVDAPNDNDLLYARAILAETLNLPEQSEKDLRSILARDPDNATALNALGYSLVDRNLRLTEAASLLEKALVLTPNDPAVIDSLGWLYYRKGDLPQALEFLRRAYSMNDDPEIAAHLGEVLWKSGDKSGAREIWGKALKKDPSHRVLNEVLEKFKP